MNAFSRSNDSPSRLSLWSCLWGGGVVWILHFLAVWVIAEFGCLTRLADPGPLEISWVAWLIMGVSLLCLGMAAGLSYFSWRCSRGGGDCFAARVGVVANPIFMLIIVAETLPVFYYLRDCGSYIS